MRLSEASYTGQNKITNKTFASVATCLSKDYPIFTEGFTKFVTLHKHTQYLTYTYIITDRSTDIGERRIYKTERYSDEQMDVTVLIKNI
jgi:hypothetical protein